MDKKLIYKKPEYFHNSFKKVEYKKVPCSQGEDNLNESGEKSFVWKYPQMMAYFHDSLIMEKFTIKDTIDEITLENDYFPNKYDSVKLKIGTEDIECITSYPGIVSTIIQLISTSDIYKKKYGSLSGWFPDDDSDITKDKGFIARKEYYNGKTTITLLYPLKYLFGIFSYYRKVFYGIEDISLEFQRLSDDTLSKRIFYGSKLKDEATVAVLPKFKTKKFEWWVPVYTPNPTANELFHHQLNNDKNIGIGYLKRRIAKTAFATSDYTWTISEVPNHVRYVFLVFKSEKDNPKKNNSLFTAVSIRKLQVSVNGEEYPEINLNTITGDIGEPYLSYTQICTEFGIEPHLSIKEYISFYPIFCFNTTAQNELLTNNSVSISIEKDGTNQINAYALLLEEEQININLASKSITKLKQN